MIKKFDEMLFESTEETTKDVGEERVPEPEKEVEKPTEKAEVKEETPSEKEEQEVISESVHTFANFLLEGDGGGVAYATNGNTAGMGAIVAPQPSATPGDVAGSTKGSGDLPAYDMGKKFDTNPFKKKKKSKKKSKSTKESRHVGTNQDKEEMYITSFSDWVDKDITN